MKIGRLLVGAGALTITSLAVAPGVAWAHIAEADADCEQLVVGIDAYSDSTVTTIVIDGVATTRTGNGVWEFDWDRSATHVWSVHVEEEGTEWDRDFSGTEEPCPDTTTTTTPATTTTLAAPTTTAPGGTTTTTPGGGGTTTTAVAAVPVGGDTTTPEFAVSAVGGPAPAGPAPAQRASSTLPATGSTSAPVVIVAGVTLVAGAALWLVSRRRALG